MTGFDVHSDVFVYRGRAWRWVHWRSEWCWHRDNGGSTLHPFVFVRQKRTLDLPLRGEYIDWVIAHKSCLDSQLHLFIFNDIWHNPTIRVHDKSHVTVASAIHYVMPLSRNFGDSNAGWSPGDHIRINLWRESSAKTSGNSTFAPSVRTVSRISRLDNWFTSRSCQKQFKVSSSERIYVHKIIEEHS